MKQWKRNSLVFVEHKFLNNESLWEDSDLNNKNKTMLMKATKSFKWKNLNVKEELYSATYWSFIKLLYMNIVSSLFTLIC